MILLLIMVVLAALLCSLVAGFLFAFAVVAMPGIRALDDAQFIRAFQVMDRVIQDRQPVFMLVWLGSVLTVLAAAGLGVLHLQGAERALVVAASVVYLAGVQVPTVAINIPLNDAIQSLDVQSATDAARAEARRAFEPRWNRWNVVRTIFACLTSLALISLLAML